MKDVLICNYAKTNETDKTTNAMGKGQIANYVLETMKMPESDMQEEEKQKMDEEVEELSRCKNSNNRIFPCGAVLCYRFLFGKHRCQKGNEV